MTSTPLRRPARWMARLDDRILESISVTGPTRRFALFQRFADLGGGLAYPFSYLRGRVDQLLAYGLLEERGDGRLDLSDDGRAYLSGSLDAAALTRSGAGTEAAAGAQSDDRVDADAGLDRIE